MQFEKIYQDYRLKIYRLCKSYTNNEEWAKDLVQETFIQVYLNLKNFRNKASVGTWIYRIATNICLRQIEKASRMKKTDFSFPELKMEIHDNTDQIHQLYRCIAQLEKTERLIITMVLDGLSHQEISEVLGITEGNVRVKVHRIKKLLTELYKAHESV